MRKYVLGLLVFSLMLFANYQVAQASDSNVNTTAQHESSIKGRKHPVAKTNRGNESSTNIGSNKRQEGKEKAIERRLEGKEKAIERRLEGKQKMLENRSQNAPKSGHKGHGKHKRNLNNSSVQGHTNRGEIVNSTKTQE